MKKKAKKKANKNPFRIIIGIILLIRQVNLFNPIKIALLMTMLLLERMLKTLRILVFLMELLIIKL